jgi:AraC-like DNA-binding protein
MKTLIQKIHVEENHSFACRKYRTPQFETNWHKHKEYELIVITEGHGTALIGDYVGDYKAGDVFFLGSDLPHWFRKTNQKMIGSAIVVHFLKDFWGERFLQMPETKVIRHLLESDNNGIQLLDGLENNISNLIQELEKADGIERIYLLMQCLRLMSQSKQYRVLTESFDTSINTKENPAIEKIFNYSFKNFLEPLTLKQVASIAGMTIPTFCRFFKRNIKKSYFDFIKELRIGHACKLLRETQDSILDVCYASGYNSWAHFSKQFKEVKLQTPNQYRKQFKETEFK